MAITGIQIGQVYEDCTLHPVFCTESDEWDVAGVSLFDGSMPRSCSVQHCGIRLLDSEEVIALISRRDDFLEAERTWKEDWRKESSSSKSDVTQTYYATIARIRSELGLAND